jgi:hypothetical protein
MVYLKTLFFGCIGLVVAFVLRMVWWFVAAVLHEPRDSRIIVSPRLLLHDPLFLVFAVVCVGLGVYLGKPQL